MVSLAGEWRDPQGILSLFIEGKGPTYRFRTVINGVTASQGAINRASGGKWLATGQGLNGAVRVQLWFTDQNTLNGQIEVIVDGGVLDVPQPIITLLRQHKIEAGQIAAKRPCCKVPIDDRAFRPEKVLLGASAPKQVTQGQQFTARFVANAEGLEDIVREILDGLSPKASHHLRAGKTYWPVDVQVHVLLRAQGLEVENPLQSFHWDGEYQLVEFDVRVPEDTPRGDTILKFDAFVEDVPAGTVRLDLAIAGLSSDERSYTSQPPFSTGFASYASEDRLRVFDRVSAVRQLTGIDIFLDCISLRAGERWGERLYEEIEDRDLFILFWSRFASQSEWVTREWKAALKTKGEQAMQIQPLEPPTEAPPPAELQHLHFNDLLTLVRAGLEGADHG